MTSAAAHRSHGPVKVSVLVIGPYQSVGGMASVMRNMLTSSLAGRYELIPLDCGKRTPPDRSVFQGLRAQAALDREMRLLLRRHRPAIAHIHTCSGLSFYRSVLHLVRARAAGCAVVLHIHGGRFGEFLAAARCGRCVVRRALRSAERVAVLSPSWAAVLREFEPGARVCVIPNGIPVPQQPEPEHDGALIHYESPHQASANSMTILFAGDLRAAKGVDDLLEAAARLPREIRERAALRFAGPDPHGRLAELRLRGAGLGLGGGVEFLGVLSPAELTAQMEAAAVLALPSHAEGLPLVVLEAMACALPVVATRVGALPEVITHGRDGLLIEPGDPSALTAHLSQLLSEADLRRRLGNAARQRVIAAFSQEHMAGVTAALYGELLAERRAQGYTGGRACAASTPPPQSDQDQWTPADAALFAADPALQNTR